MTNTATTVRKAATDLNRGDVLSNLTTDFIVTDVDDATVTYRYLDGNSIVREGTMATTAEAGFRVVTTTATYVASFLDATVGLPRNLVRSASLCRACGAPTATVGDLHPSCAE